jgi:ankyrin repeat protein
MLLITLATRVALGQATPLTKAEPLQDAARKGDAATVRKLIDESVDVNTKFCYNATALFCACDHGHVEVVKALLEKGADVAVAQR